MKANGNIGMEQATVLLLFGKKALFYTEVKFSY